MCPLNLNLNDFMGLFRSGLLACLVVGSTAIAQQGTQPAPGVPGPIPGTPDTNAPAQAPITPEPQPIPGVDPNALQPAPAIPDATQPATPAPSTAKPKPKKPTAPAAPTIRGTVGSIDKNAMTIVVHGKSKDETLNVTSKTRIFADGKPAILADAKEGENVVAEYHTTKEKAKEALTLRFGGAAAAGTSGSAADHKVSSDEKKSSPKKATTKKSAASKKKSKKGAAKPTDNAAPAPGADTSVTPLPGAADPNAPLVPPGTTTPAPTPTPVPGTPGANP